jgi:hypothetical protein
MSDHIEIKSQAPSISADSSSVARAKSSLQPYLILSAGALGFAFFLPWITISFLGTATGLDIAKDKGNDANILLWMIPCAAGVTILTAILKQRLRFVGTLTGLLPFVFALLGVVDNGPELIESLAYGAHLSLLSGFFLIVLSQRAK